MTHEMRIGLGHDTHRLAAGGPLLIGGIELDFDAHLVGHSDADVLLHAVTDALLGAANLGDIGQLFPDTDEVNRNRDSGDMLKRAYEIVRRDGWTLVNLDCVVLAEKPKLIPYKTAICARIADLLDCSPDRIGLKGKTGEQTGDVGSGKIIQAQCVCLLQRN